MLKVNEKALLDEVDRLKAELASIEKKADEAIVKLGNIPDEVKAHVKDVLVADFSKEPKENLDRLMKYVVEEPDPNPIPATA